LQACLVVAAVLVQLQYPPLSENMKKKRTCAVCGKVFFSYNKNPKFCSFSCRVDSQRDPLHKRAKEIIALYLSGSTLEECAQAFKSTEKIITNILKVNNIPRRRAIKRNQWGENNSSWKGGKHKNRAGYILLYLPDHPAASRRGLIMEHRVVMENHIGRYLKSYEVVHHKNQIKDDNRIENLELMTKSEHQALHNKMRVKKC